MTVSNEEKKQYQQKVEKRMPKSHAFTQCV